MPTLEPIAIIGIGCRFPGAAGPRAYWRLLREGRTGVREIPGHRWDLTQLYDADARKPGKTNSRWAGLLDEVDGFDWRALRVSPREAKFMDPQHRLLLEVAWEAFEDAGLTLEAIAGSRTSVHVSVVWNDYLRLLARDWSKLDGYVAAGNPMGFAANRISYTFDLRGPSQATDAACAGSLITVLDACRVLRAREADTALAGGVNLILSADVMVIMGKAGILSPEGRCKPLDATADGFVRGEGLGLVVLKRLSDVQPEDRVYAVIRGGAQNHNGRNEWIMGASARAQEEVIRAACAAAEVSPGALDYVELHGTGFARGDAVEAEALGAALAEGRATPLRIGSVKSNLGNLESAAGAASLIKTALALFYRALPPTINLQTINPAIDLLQLKLDPVRSLEPWPSNVRAPLAGVTVTAFSGANAHAVLEAVEPAPRVVRAAEPRVLVLSARDGKALLAQAADVRAVLEEGPSELGLLDFLYTAAERRSAHGHRLAVVGRTATELVAGLTSLIQGQESNQARLGTATKTPRIGFLTGSRANDAVAVLGAFGVEAEVILGEHAPHATESVPMRPVALAAEAKLDFVIDLGGDLAGLEAALGGTRPRVLPFLGQSLEEQRTTLATLWVHGAKVRWAAQFAGETPRVTGVPTYHWQHDRVWLDRSMVELSAAPEAALRSEQTQHPLLGASIDVAVPRESRVWTRTFTLRSPLDLSQYLVEGTAVVMLPALLEMVAAGAFDLLGEGTLFATDVVVRAVLALSEQPRTVQLVLSPDKGAAIFQLASRAGAAEERSANRWTVHISGRVGVDHFQEKPPARHEVDHLRSLTQAELPGRDYYRYLEFRGIALGDRFQAVDHVWQGERDIIARLKRPASVPKGELSRYLLHPALGAASFDILADTALIRGVFDELDRALDLEALDVPVGLDRFVWYKRPQEELWVHARIRAKKAAEAELANVDLDLFDEEGLVASIERLKLRRTLRTTFAAAQREALQDRGMDSGPLRPTATKFVRDLAAADPEGRHQMLVDHTRAVVTQILKIEGQAPVRHNQPLFEVGLDSISALDLKAQLGGSLGLRLPSTLVFDYPTLDRLADFLAASVLESTFARRGSERLALDGADAELFGRVERMTEPEAEALLLDRLRVLE